MMPLIIRADANRTIGQGHLMRCLALGLRWRERGGMVTWLGACEDLATQQRLECAGIRYVPLAQPHPASQDLAALIEISTGSVDRPWTILDGYHFDAEFQRALCEAGVRFMVLDDHVHLDYYHANVILNQNILAPQFSYACRPDTRLLLGTAYTLLRPEFRSSIPPQRSDSVSRILVTMGGADPDNVTLKVLRALEPMRHLEVIAVVGAHNPHRETLLSAFPEESRISLAVDPPSMPDLMAWADIAISASGSTCWELAYMGVPALLVVVADNQLAIAQGLDQAGICQYLGWASEVTDAALQVALESLRDDLQRVRRMRENGRALIDGQGAQRVIDALLAAD